MRPTRIMTLTIITGIFVIAAMMPLSDAPPVSYDVQDRMTVNERIAPVGTVQTGPPPVLEASNAQDYQGNVQWVDAGSESISHFGVAQGDSQGASSKHNSVVYNTANEDITTVAHDHGSEELLDTCVENLVKLRSNTSDNLGRMSKVALDTIREKAALAGELEQARYEIINLKHDLAEGKTLVFVTRGILILVILFIIGAYAFNHMNQTKRGKS